MPSDDERKLRDAEAVLLSMRAELRGQEASIREAKMGIAKMKMARRSRKMVLADADRELRKLEAGQGSAAEGEGLADAARALRARFGIGEAMAGSRRDDSLAGLRRSLDAVQVELADDDAVMRQRMEAALSQGGSFRYRQGLLAEAQEKLAVLAASMLAAGGDRGGGDQVASRALARLHSLQEAFADATVDDNPIKILARMPRAGGGISLGSSSSLSSLASSASTVDAPAPASNAPSSPSAATPPPRPPSPDFKAATEKAALSPTGTFPPSPSSSDSHHQTAPAEREGEREEEGPQPEAHGGDSEAATEKAALSPAEREGEREEEGPQPEAHGGVGSVADWLSVPSVADWLSIPLGALIPELVLCVVDGQPQYPVVL